MTTTVGFPTLPFKVAIARATPNEEMCLVTALPSGVAMTVTRGFDGTSAVTHNLGDAVEHAVGAGEYEAANAHIEDTTLDQHTQYLTAARHAAIDHSSLLNDVVSVVPASGSARTLAMATAKVWDVTLDQNCVFTITGEPASGVVGILTLVLREPSSLKTWSFTDTVIWDGGSPPTLTVSSKNILQLVTLDGGATWFGSVAGLAFA